MFHTKTNRTGIIHYANRCEKNEIEVYNIIEKCLKKRKINRFFITDTIKSGFLKRLIILFYLR